MSDDDYYYYGRGRRTDGLPRPHGLLRGPENRVTAPSQGQGRRPASVRGVRSEKLDGRRAAPERHFPIRAVRLAIAHGPVATDRLDREVVLECHSEGTEALARPSA